MKVLDIMNIKDIAVYKGSDSSFVDFQTPCNSEGADAIIHEAMREDTNTPLYVLCGAGMTNIASAYLKEPRIAKHIKAVVWIGGSEYTDLCKNQIQRNGEYNFGIDRKAAQVVFNHSDLAIWQIPRDVYRQCLYSYAELKYRIGAAGKMGAYLMARLDDLLVRAKTLGEAYILGDSPLVLVTALQSAWEADAVSCEYVMRPMPLLEDNGGYKDNPEGRPVRVYTKVDNRLILEDLVAKLSLLK